MSLSYLQFLGKAGLSKKPHTIITLRQDAKNRALRSSAPRSGPSLSKHRGWAPAKCSRSQSPELWRERVQLEGTSFEWVQKMPVTQRLSSQLSAEPYT